MDESKGLGNDFDKCAFNFTGTKITYTESLELALAWEIRHGSNERAKIAFEILNNSDKFWSLYEHLMAAHFEG